MKKLLFTLALILCPLLVSADAPTTIIAVTSDTSTVYSNHIGFVGATVSSSGYKAIVTIPPGNAPTDATYITQTANGTLSAEQALSGLTTGLAIVTNGTGAITTTANNSTNWDTAYTDRLKWDGGATGLTAATGRTSLELGSLATLSSVDISSNTNLAGDTEIVLTGDALSIASTITRDTELTPYALLASPTFTTQITTPKIVSAGDMTIDAVNAAANSTVYVLNSNGTYVADLNVEGDLVVTDITVSTGGTLQLGQNGTDGILKIFSEQGVTDYIASLYSNTAMTSAASFYLPVDEPVAESFLKMGTDGIIDYDTTVLGSIATQAANNVSISGGSITGITDLTVADGGTGKSSWTQYLIPYADTTTSFSQIAIGTSGQVLTSNGAGLAPTFQTASSSGATTALDNLASVAINTSLLSDTDNTDDLGSAAKTWANTYSTNLLVNDGSVGTSGVGVIAIKIGTIPSSSPADEIQLYSEDIVVAAYTSQYPPAQSDTYVKSTSEYGVNFKPYFATDPALSLTGTNTSNQWVAAAGGTTNQRFHIDLGSAKLIKRIYYENGHSSGTNTNDGANNFTFWGSNTAGSFAELTYGTDTGWTQITPAQSTFDVHTGSDVADPKYITVTNTTAYRYYAFKFADTISAPTYAIQVRRIELQTQNVLAELRVRDEAGNVTTLSPHNFKNMPNEQIVRNQEESDGLAWSYHSEKGGKEITVDMFNAIRDLEKITNRKYIYTDQNTEIKKSDLKIN